MRHLLYTSALAVCSVFYCTEALAKGKGGKGDTPSPISVITAEDITSSERSWDDLNQIINRTTETPYQRPESAAPIEFSNYDRDTAMILQNAVTEAETRCFNAADLMTEGAALERYRLYYNALSRLRSFYEDPNTPRDIKVKFERDYLDDKGGFKKKRCPPNAPPYQYERQSDQPLGQFSDVEIRPTYAGGTVITQSFTASAGYTERELPQTGYGFRSTGDTEIYAGLSDDRLSGEHFGGVYSRYRDAATAYTGRGVGNHHIETDWIFGASYEHLDGTAFGRVENGTDNTGIVYHDRAPNGSTGVAIGNRGLDVATATDHEIFEGYVNKFLRTAGPIKPYVGLEASFGETTHEATISTPSFFDIGSRSTQTIDNNIISAVIGAQIDRDLTDKWSFNVQADISVGGVFSDLDSVQINECGLCATDERSFSINIEHSRSKLTIGLRGSASLSYEIAENVSVGPRISADWRSDIGYPRNPQSGDDLFLDNNPTHLEFKDTFGYRADFGITVNF